LLYWWLLSQVWAWKGPCDLYSILCLPFSFPSNFLHTQRQTASPPLQTIHSRCLMPFSNNSLSFLPQHHRTPAQKLHLIQFLKTSDMRYKTWEHLILCNDPFMKNTIPEHFWFIILFTYTAVQTHLNTSGEFSCTQYWRSDSVTFLLCHFSSSPAVSSQRQRNGVSESLATLFIHLLSLLTALTDLDLGQYLPFRVSFCTF